MAKITFLPDKHFPPGIILNTRISRNGTIISTRSATTKKINAFPSAATELSVAKQCLHDARYVWARWTIEQQIEWSSLARLFCTPRFPAPSYKFSDFNLFYSQFSAFWYGNYYFNGALSYFDGTSWQPFYHNSFVEPEYNRIYEPKPSIIGNYYYKSTNFTIQETPILNITNETFNFRLNYSFPPGTPTHFNNFGLWFSGMDSQAGFLFYISNPGIDAGLSFARGNRLLIATYKPDSISSTGANLYPSTFLDLKGPLAKYYDLSILNLRVGMKVKITAFVVSSYGQCYNLGVFPSTII